MRTHKIPTLFAAAAILALTGCGDPIDKLGDDATRAERDEVYTGYLADTYTDADGPGWVDFNLRLCSVMDSEKVRPAEFDDLFEEEGVTEEKRPDVQDIIYQGVRVYCPENLSQVEFLRPVVG
jgi:hypothetical protein